MKTYQRLTSLVICLLFVLTAQAKRVKHAGWLLSFNSGKLTITLPDGTLLSAARAEADINGRTVRLDEYQRFAFRKTKVNDAFGAGLQWTITATAAGKPMMVVDFNIYKDYLIAQTTLASPQGLRSRAIVPLTFETQSLTGRHKLFVPYDNDAWIRYASPVEIGDHFRSYEVSAVYDAQSRRGLVMGFIDHDHWKNAVDIDHGKVLTLKSGVADSLTRDHNPHGALRGERVASARVMVGSFSDWREGLETFARLNAIVAPRRPWDKAMPVGWNSWGALAFSVNHQNATEVSDFFTQELMPNHFHNADGLVYTGLDSGWNSFPEDQLKDFAAHCAAHQQVPCIYWTPFTDWARDPNRTVVEGEPWKYKDIYLYANGKPQELDGAYAIDPTHPAVRRMMEQTADLFRRCGYKYVKMDFMTHGRMEADHFYDPNITTGTEAYCRGMQLLDSIFGDMYINLSISPIFPAQYAQSRRIACDAWNKIKDTEYTMNALSYGWWVGKVYQFNDADHIVLRQATEGENRARITSSVITGLYITGDDFSAKGDSIAKARARQFLTNPDINSLATGQSFRPLNGDSESGDNSFVRTEPDGSVVLALFNYAESPRSLKIPFERIGLKSMSASVTELWSHRTLDPAATISIPAKDVVVLRLRP